MHQHRSNNRSGPRPGCEPLPIPDTIPGETKLLWREVAEFKVETSSRRVWPTATNLGDAPIDVEDGGVYSWEPATYFSLPLLGLDMSRSYRRALIDELLSYVCYWKSRNDKTRAGLASAIHDILGRPFTPEAAHPHLQTMYPRFPPDWSWASYLGAKLNNPVLWAPPSVPRWWNLEGAIKLDHELPCANVTYWLSSYHESSPENGDLLRGIEAMFQIEKETRSILPYLSIEVENPDAPPAQVVRRLVRSGGDALHNRYQLRVASGLGFGNEARAERSWEGIRHYGITLGWRSFAVWELTSYSIAEALEHTPRRWAPWHGGRMKKLLEGCSDFRDDLERLARWISAIHIWGTSTYAESVETDLRFWGSRH